MTAALGMTIFDFSVGDTVVGLADLALGENAENGVYTIPGYWAEAPAAPIPGPAPAPTVTPNPAIISSPTITPSPTITAGPILAPED